MNIEQMAQECGKDVVQKRWGATGFQFEVDELERFAALVRAQALEEAAAVCDELPVPPDCPRDSATVFDMATLDCADAIRALKSDSKPLGGEG